MNFGGIGETEFSDFEKARIFIFPVSYDGTVAYETRTANGAAAIIDASRGMELYEEETDAEVYRIGIHTLESFQSRPTPETMMNALYERTRELLKHDKFICTLGGEHSISAPLISAHAERFHNLSVLHIDAHADLRDEPGENRHSHRSVMARVIKDLRIQAVQVGVRSISAAEAQTIADGIPTKIYWAKYAAGRTDWIGDAISNLTENVYLTIDISGLDPSLTGTSGGREPGGLGWYETLALIRKTAAKKRIVGMDLVEFSPAENQKAPAFLCAKLVYKTLAYIFRGETAKIIGVI